MGVEKEDMVVVGVNKEEAEDVSLILEYLNKFS